MVGEHADAILEQIDRAVASVGELALRRAAPALWERRSAQVWYRITARTGAPLASNQVQIDIGIVVPLIDRIVGPLDRHPDAGTIGGNLLRFSTDGAGTEQTFELAPSSVRGRVAARLRAPVLGDPTVRTVAADEPFVEDVADLLRTRMLPWVQITTWSQVAEALATYGEVLAAEGLVDARHRGLQGVMRWASGAHGVGEALIVEDFGPGAPEILRRLQDRFTFL